MNAERKTTRSAGTTRGQLIARLHCIKHERQWDTDEYRDILQGVTGQRSAADLDFAGLCRAIAVLGGKPVQVTPAGSTAASGSSNEWAFIVRAATEKRPLLRKIAATCTALSVGRHYAEGIAKRQSGGVERRLEMCSTDELYKIAAALVNTQRSRQKATSQAGDPA